MGGIKDLRISMFNQKAQSTVEYLLLVTAVIMVALLVTSGNTSIFQNRLTNVFNMTTNGMQAMANRLANMALTP